MRRRFVAAVFVVVVVAVALADAATNPQPTYRIAVTKPDRDGARLAMVCALFESSDNFRLYFNLSVAALDLFGDGGEVGAAYTTTRDDKLCVAVYAIGEGPPPKPVEVGATVRHGGAPLSTARSAVDIRISGKCPFKVKNGAGRRCTPGRVDFFQIFGTQSDRKACDLFIDDELPFENVDLLADWKGVPRLVGQETTLPPGQVVPALLELGCGKSTSRSRTLARAIGVPLPTPATRPPTPPPSTTDPIRPDPVAARCRALFVPVGFTPGAVGAAGGSVDVRCGVDVKSMSLSAGSGGQKIASFQSGGSCATVLAGRALSCTFRGPNTGRSVGFIYRTDQPFASTTLHVLAGGYGTGGTTIVLRQSFFFSREGMTCSQTAPSAATCARL